MGKRGARRRSESHSSPPSSMIKDEDSLCNANLSPSQHAHRTDGADTTARTTLSAAAFAFEGLGLDFAFPCCSFGVLMNRQWRGDVLVHDNQPCARLSSTIVQRPSKCAAAPCLFTRSAPNVTVAQASDPRWCTPKSSFSRNLMLRFGSKSAFCTPVRYSDQFVVFHRNKIKVSKVSVRCIVRFDLGYIQNSPTTR